MLLLLFPFLLLSQLFDSQRRSSNENGLSVHVTAAGWLYLGWSLHYLPFFVMGRALYVHHYYPALVFSCGLTGVLLDLGLRRLAAAIRLPVLGALAVLLIFSFQLFSPLVYGFRGDQPRFENSSVHHLQWLDKWYF